MTCDDTFEFYYSPYITMTCDGTPCTPQTTSNRRWRCRRLRGAHTSSAPLWLARPRRCSSGKCEWSPSRRSRQISLRSKQQYLWIQVVFLSQTRCVNPNICFIPYISQTNRKNVISLTDKRGHWEQNYLAGYFLSKLELIIKEKKIETLMVMLSSLDKDVIHDMKNGVVYNLLQSITISLSNNCILPQRWNQIDRDAQTGLRSRGLVSTNHWIRWLPQRWADVFRPLPRGPGQSEQGVLYAFLKKNMSHSVAKGLGNLKWHVFALSVR